MALNTNELPKMSMDIAETNCCPPFNPQPWEEKELNFRDKKFVKMHTRSFMHIPLNMGKVMMTTWEKVKKADAEIQDGYLLLTCDSSPWKAEHFMAVTKEVPGLENVTLSGKFLTKVFEGPYKDAGRWVKETVKYAKSKNQKVKRVFAFYTTCPKCAKHFGKNYVVMLAQIV